MSLTAEQTLMHEVVNLISDKYSYPKNEQMIKDAEKITSAILNYTNDDKDKE
ncbi:hypothetical protein [Psychrobacter sp. 4Bb]|uniref:hypothetical protein n=1 Tax=Psychrobacter sp. 4Bb TaxID=888436 RepID=UPI0015E06431|nr:hypothetical protein [Psychrobacter sp. 4Bb]|tara:strand:- start:293 stop:448 length:156 start_codon:yes stop_codon:yes gene_type:complete